MRGSAVEHDGGSGEVPRAEVLVPAGGSAFVGRQRELSELSGALDHLADGVGSLSLVMGEAGIGKTYLARQVVEAAKAEAVPVTTVRCWDGASLPSYFVWTAFSSSLPGDVAALFHPATHEGPTGSAPVNVPEFEGEPDLARFRLFESVRARLTDLQNGPRVLFIDDLHAADAASLLLLEYLAPHLRQLPLAVLATCRPPELVQREEWKHTAARLQRDARVLQLGGLSPAEIAELMQSVLGRRPTDEVVATVRVTTGGNPFQVAQLLRGLGAAASPTDPLPFDDVEGLGSVLRRRVGSLGERALRVLETASVLGERFSLLAVSDMTGLTLDTVLEALAAAADLGVVQRVEEPDGFCFGHALIRDALYEGLSWRRQAALHRDAAAALHRLGATHDNPGEIAHHTLRALPEVGPEAVARTAAVAGRHALDRFDYHDAVTHFERARHYSSTPATSAPGQQIDILTGLGEALIRTGRVHEGRERIADAAEVARTARHREGLARAALSLGGAQWWTGATDEMRGQLLEEAADALEGTGSPLLARVLARLAGERYWAGSYRMAEDLSERALAEARRIGSSGDVVEALLFRHLVLRAPQHLEERLHVAHEVITIAASVDHSEFQMAGHLARLVDAMEVGDHDLVELDAGRIATLGETFHDVSFRWAAALLEALRTMNAGRLEEAEAVALRAFALGQEFSPRTALQWYGAQLTNIRWLQGRLSEMAGLVESAFATEPNVRPALILVRCEQGDFDEARRLFEEEMRRPPLDAADSSRSQWLVGSADTCVALEAREYAEAILEQIAPLKALTCTVWAGANGGAMARQAGKLATLLGRWEEASSYLERALEMNRRMRFDAFVTLTRLDQARLHLARDGAGDRQAARRLLECVAREAGEMGMAGIERQAKDELARYAERDSPGLEVRTLGRFAVLHEGAPVPSGVWQSRRARDLIKILVSRRGQPIPREELMEILWPGEDPTRLSNRLSQALSTAKAVVERGGRPAIVADRQAVALQAPPAEVDLWRFFDEVSEGLRLVHASRPDEARPLLERALGRYHGDFVDEDRYEEWSVPTREEAKTAFVAASRALAAIVADHGDIDHARRLLTNVLEKDPYDEDGHLSLIDLLARSGRSSEARRRYETYLARMREIGVTARPYPHS